MTTNQALKTMEEDESKEDLQLPSWVRQLAFDDARDRDCWPPRHPGLDFDWNKPTSEVYHDPLYSDFSPEFKEARRKLDYSYHRNPARSRQELQDVILARVVEAAIHANRLYQQAHEATTRDESKEGEEEKQQPAQHQRRPWIVFSAGPMGVGKGYVMSTLNERGLFPMDRFLKIDPDLLKTELPEMTGYLAQDPASAATKVHRESTQMADVLLEHALQMRIPTLVDGSLRDVEYYRSFMERIRREFPEYQIAILQITASPGIIKQRAQSRAEKTGRAVPEELLQASIDQVPASVKALSPNVDVVFTVSNEDHQPLHLVKAQGNGRYKSITKGKPVTHSLTWQEFRDTWWTSVSGEQKKVCRLLPKWCDKQCPGISQYKTCWMNKACLKSAKAAFSSAYPSFCPACALAGRSCGICAHNKHWCQCNECGPSSAVYQEKQQAKKHECSLTASMNALFGGKKSKIVEELDGTCC